jgi:predicted phosphodiesterase
MATVASQIIREAAAKTPDIPSRTLARNLYAKHPEVWKNLDYCRGAVRRVLGVNGKRDRNKGNKSLHRAPREAGWKTVIPESIKRVWKPFVLDGEWRGPILSDIHIPFHCEESLEAALDYAAERKPNIIILNGDTGDHHSESDYVKDPRERDMKGELHARRYFFAGLHRRFPKARKIFKKGNHEERWDKYMWVKAAELLGIDDFEFATVNHLPQNGFEVIDDKRRILFGKLNVLHGHEYRYSFGAPVNAARWLFTKANCHALCGHFHATSQHSENTANQDAIATFSTGCLCDLNPQWLPLNKWNNGFAWAETDKSGAFKIDNLRIRNGKVY